MRILKFAHVDYLKTRRLNYLLLIFPLLAVAFLVTSVDSRALFAVAYCLFAGIILAAFPFSVSSNAERGFLQMLPSKPGEPILGHYLYGFFMILVSFLVGIAAVLIARIIHPELEILRLGGADVTGIYLLLPGIALLFTGVEALLLTALRFENAHIASLLRIIPAFVFFYGFNSGAKNVQGLPDCGVGEGLAAAGICIGIFLILALVSRAISVRRGE